MSSIIETVLYGLLIAVVSLGLNLIIPKNNAVAAAPQVGQASWYGGFHHGRKMANGKPFNMYANTVAHRTLPLGTVVEVVNRSNGRSVTATVTDRGPYAKRRVLDVSRGIANKLDMLTSGTATVEIIVVSLPERKSRHKDHRQTETAKSNITPDIDNITLLINDINQPPLWVRN